MTSFREVHIRAPAKINLALEVHRRRPDGYHEIRTLFQTISLYDHLRLRRRKRGIVLRCRNFPDSGPGNLAWKAAEHFFACTGVGGGIEIGLDKNIPVGGGLGGGSSDAAAVLLGASRLYGLRPPPGELGRWAAALGSDVPFFIDGGAAVGTGRGEIIEPLQEGGPDCAVLLCDPGMEVSTSAVYRRYVPCLTREKDALTILLTRWKSGRLGPVGSALSNDLEETLFELQPSLRRVRERLIEEGAAGARVTGSGACLFGLFPTKEKARTAGSRLGREFPGRFSIVEFIGPRRSWGVVKR